MTENEIRKQEIDFWVAHIKNMQEVKVPSITILTNLLIDMQRISNKLDNQTWICNYWKNQQ